MHELRAMHGDLAAQVSYAGKDEKVRDSRSLLFPDPVVPQSQEVADWAHFMKTVGNFGDVDLGG